MPSDVKIRVWHTENGSHCGVTVRCQVGWHGWPGVTDGDPGYGIGNSINISKTDLERAYVLLTYMRDSAAGSFWSCVLQKDAMENWWEIEYPYEVTEDELNNPIDLIGGWPDIEGELEWAEARRNRNLKTTRKLLGVPRGTCDNEPHRDCAVL